MKNLAASNPNKISPIPESGTADGKMLRLVRAKPGTSNPSWPMGDQCPVLAIARLRLLPPESLPVYESTGCNERRVIRVTSGGQFQRTGMKSVPTPVLV